MTALDSTDDPRCWWSGAAADRPTADGSLPRRGVGDADHDDVELFERLALESFQAGLSWSTILRKREAFAAASTASTRPSSPPSARTTWSG
jgi:DNA-3-methyladenine glycosylase I